MLTSRHWCIAPVISKPGEKSTLNTNIEKKIYKLQYYIINLQ